MWTEAFLRPELRALPVLERAWGPQDADLETTAQKAGTEPTWEGTGGEKALGAQGVGPRGEPGWGPCGGGEGALAPYLGRNVQSTTGRALKGRSSISETVVAGVGAGAPPRSPPCHSVPGKEGGWWP